MGAPSKLAVNKNFKHLFHIECEQRTLFQKISVWERANVERMREATFHSMWNGKITNNVEGKEKAALVKALPANATAPPTQ